MNSPGNGVAHRVGIAEAALWASAGLIVLTAQLCAAAWLLREQLAVAADSVPPPAIMIELAPEPEAVLTEESEISPDPQPAEESIPVVDEVEELDETPPDEPAQEIVEAEPVEPEPVEEERVEEIDPVEEQILAQLDKAEIPIPVARPSPPRPEIVKREKPKKTEPKKTPRKQKPAAASKPAVQAQAQVKRSDRTAASKSVSGLFSSSMTPAKWQSRLRAHLERRKKYPSGARSRGERGVVHVRFRIDDAGNVLSASLAASSGFPELDREVLALVRRASPVPAPPPGANRTITAPVRFGER